ncbi:MAG: SlyX family protein [Chromatiales bacterium]|nr:SlyX family protein [Chromatiales bacterium]
MDSRIEAIEVKCAHLEHALQELSEELYRQQQALDRNGARIEEILRMLGELSARPAAPAGDMADEVPPHY